MSMLPTPGNYTLSAVTMTAMGTAGVIFLGTIWIILLNGLQRTLARNRMLEIRCAQQSSKWNDCSY